ALVENASGGVKENVRVRVAHRAHDAGGLLGAGEAEVRVDGDADDVQRRQRVVVDVERAVAHDVHLGTGEDANAVEACVQARDLRTLSPELGRVGAAGHGETHPVIGDPDRLHAQPA